MIEQLDELDRFLEQSNISEKNVRRLEMLAMAADNRVRKRASAILDVARLYPHKRRRYVRLRREKPQLLRRLRTELGDGWWDDLSVSGALGDALGQRDPDGADCSASVQLKPTPNGHELKHVTIHTDGACRNNPGPGGWAAILRCGNHVKEIKG
ncbi:MAG: hypothetical protein L0Z50_34585, partial [Verrucomicrobiales bacterium]|nr:hypothetical protein [Verrucomicrobiales bacterium]